MSLHFWEENLPKKPECSTLTSNLEGTAVGLCNGEKDK